MINTLYKKAQEYSDIPIHAVIMFTSSHAHVVQMLEDQRYYNALDEMTGSSIALFHTRLFPGEYEMPIVRPGIMSQMIPVWKEPHENKQLLALFDMQNSACLPCLVTFQFANGKIYHAQSSIAKDSPEAVFNSLECIVQRLTKVANKANDRLQAMKDAAFEMRALNFKKGITEFISKVGLIRGATGI